MTDFKPYESELEASPELSFAETPDSALDSQPKEGNMKLLVVLMIVFWPAAVYYAITRDFKH